MEKLNQKGSILVNALIATIIIAIISGVILQQSLTTMRTLRLPRIKSVMTSVEGALRHSLLQPATFGGSCNSDMGILASCNIPAGFEAKFSVDVPGCILNPPTPCGVRLNGAFDKNTHTYNGILSYEGTEVPVSPRNVSIVVPLEVLQSANINCPDATPIFTGFNADGIKQCRALEGSCGPGTYLVGFNTTNLTAICQPLPTGNKTCPSGTAQYYNSFTWAATGASGTCINRPLPSTLFP